jgi:hypothetical protein
LLRCAGMATEGRFEHPRYGRWAYSMTWAMIRGVSRPKTLSLEPLDDPPKVAATDPHLVEAVESFDRDRRSSEMRDVAGELQGTDLGERLERLARLQGSPDAGSPEHLRRVASIYRTEERAAREVGRRAKPRERIREEMGYSLAWASKYIARARKQTDPATGRPFLEPPKGREN